MTNDQHHPHYLYLEAVNLGNVIDDTEDLSTRRAGGYMLLELVHKVKEACAAELEAISVGASAGLFSLRAGQSMNTACTKLEGILKTPLYAQATVLIADTETDRVDNSSFKAAREGMLACVRLKQMQTLGLITDFAVPSETAQGKSLRRATNACEIDGVRPAVSEETFKREDETRWQSQSVTLRRRDGMALRRRFYGRELLRAETTTLPDKVKEGLFTDHFDELTRFNEDYAGQLPPALEHKMAVFYADGDDFGKLAASCETAADLSGWDQTVQQARRGFLRSLVERIELHPYGLLAAESKKGEKKPDRLRIETLMWGGDEFLIVLPAWLALEAAELFFKTCCVQWPQGHARSHSTALVFAHHNAPIGPLQALARNLADTAKAAKKAASKTSQTAGGLVPDHAPAAGFPAGTNSLNWMVLESFDHAGGELGDYWQRRGLPTIQWPQMTLGDAQLAALRLVWPQVSGHLPRRAVHRIVQGLQDWGHLDQQQRRLVQRAYTNVHEAVGAAAAANPAADAWRSLWQALQPGGGTGQAWAATPNAEATAAVAPQPDPAHLSAWLMLNELWDYLPPEPSTTPQNQAPRSQNETSTGATA